MHYWLVDVFAAEPLSGNGLTVFPDAIGLNSSAMQELTRELRQFETIFLSATDDPLAFSARIFTLEEELGFAGHPVLGAAALLHHLHAEADQLQWSIEVPAKLLRVSTRRQGSGFYAQMDQGEPEYGKVLSSTEALWFAEAFSTNLDHRYPAQVISTGLPYLILPVTSKGLTQAKQHREVGSRLAGLAASFVYLLDVDAQEGRTWDPLGVVEDIATGSAAGPVAGFLLSHGLVRIGQEITLHQGRFLGRPSQMSVHLNATGRIEVGGEVQLVSSSTLLPELRQI